jgi:hypothetical protein
MMFQLVWRGINDEEEKNTTSNKKKRKINGSKSEKVSERFKLFGKKKKLTLRRKRGKLI